MLGALSRRKDPEDCTQMAFVEEYYSRSKPVETTASFRSFMIRKGIWLSIKEHHRGKRHLLDSESGSGEGKPGVLEMTADGRYVLANLAADQGEWVALIRWGFRELTQEDVTHIYLRLMKLSSTEIAEFMGTNAVNERTMWGRLKRKVKELYEVDLDSILG